MRSAELPVRLALDRSLIAWRLKMALETLSRLLADIGQCGMGIVANTIEAMDAETLRQAFSSTLGSTDPSRSYQFRPWKIGISHG